MQQVPPASRLWPAIPASGSGKRHISGGRAPLHQALYMPSLVAVRYNAAMRVTCNALLVAGKPPKVAFVPIMRSLLILANSLIRDGRT